MDALRWSQRPELQRPIFVAAFAGWNDAGDAATLAARWMDEQWGIDDLATIDAEEFFDFTETRPQVRIIDGVSRTIDWPENVFRYGRTPNGRDIIFLHGTEPQLRWRTFCGLIDEVLRTYQVETMLTLGSLLADVAHTRPAPVSIHTIDEELVRMHRVRPSHYEGPTGITGVLQHQVARPALTAASLWVAVPHYVSQTPSPKGTLALVERASEILQLPIDTGPLQIAAATYERQIDELVAADEEMAEYVTQLEAAQESEPEGINADRLTAEVEQYLRDHRQ